MGHFVACGEMTADAIQQQQRMDRQKEKCHQGMPLEVGMGIV
jgi:hypothetical protein